jgi:hypothetical protein
MDEYWWSGSLGKRYLTVLKWLKIVKSGDRDSWMLIPRVLLTLMLVEDLMWQAKYRMLIVASTKRLIWTHNWDTRMCDLWQFLYKTCRTSLVLICAISCDLCRLIYRRLVMNFWQSIKSTYLVTMNVYCSNFVRIVSRKWIVWPYSRKYMWILA